MFTLPSIEKLLEEFERLTLDERVYFSFQSEEELEVCIHYKRGEARAWSTWYALSQEASKQNCSRGHMPFVLKAFKINERRFVREIASVLLTQAAYADEFVRQVTQLLGEEAVRNSILETQKFMDHMTDVVASLLEKKEPRAKVPTLEQVVDNQRAAPPLDDSSKESPNKGRLRIIRT